VPAGRAFTFAALTHHHTCGLTVASGTGSPPELVCWGTNYYGQGDVPQGITFAAAGVGERFTCGVHEATTHGMSGAYYAPISCWGVVEEDVPPEHYPPPLPPGGPPPPGSPPPPPSPPIDACTEDEARPNGDCEQRCTNSAEWTPICACYPGYELRADGQTCGPEARQLDLTDAAPPFMSETYTVGPNGTLWLDFDARLAARTNPNFALIVDGPPIQGMWVLGPQASAATREAVRLGLKAVQTHQPLSWFDALVDAIYDSVDMVALAADAAAAEAAAANLSSLGLAAEGGGGNGTLRRLLEATGLRSSEPAVPAWRQLLNARRLQTAADGAGAGAGTDDANANATVAEDEAALTFADVASSVGLWEGPTAAPYRMEAIDFEDLNFANEGVYTVIALATDLGTMLKCGYTTELVSATSPEAAAAAATAASVVVAGTVAGAVATTVGTSVASGVAASTGGAVGGGGGAGASGGDPVTLIGQVQVATLTSQVHMDLGESYNGFATGFSWANLQVLPGDRADAYAEIDEADEEGVLLDACLDAGEVSGSGIMRARRRRLRAGGRYGELDDDADADVLRGAGSRRRQLRHLARRVKPRRPQPFGCGPDDGCGLLTRARVTVDWLVKTMHDALLPDDAPARAHVENVRRRRRARARQLEAAAERRRRRRLSEQQQQQAEAGSGASSSSSDPAAPPAPPAAPLAPASPPAPATPGAPPASPSPPALPSPPATPPAPAGPPGEAGSGGGTPPSPLSPPPAPPPASANEAGAADGTEQTTDGDVLSDEEADAALDAANGSFFSVDASIFCVPVSSLASVGSRCGTLDESNYIAATSMVDGSLSYLSNMQSSAEGFFLNNVVALVLLFLALVLFHLAIIQYVKRKALKKGRPWNGPPNAIAFPCWEVSVLMVCYQSICQSCVVVMRISKCPGYFWGALFVLTTFAGGFLCWAAHFTWSRVHKGRVPGLRWETFTKEDRRAACRMLGMVKKEKTRKDKFRRLQLSMTKITESWLNRGEWTGNHKFISMYGSLFDDFTERRFYGAIWMELGRKLCMAVALGMMRPDAGLAQVLATLTIVAVSLVFTLCARPYAKFSKNMSYVVVNAAQTGMFLMMLLTMLDPFGDVDALSGMLMNLNLGSIGYNSAFSMAGIVATVVSFVANLGKLFAQAQVAYVGFKETIAPVLGQLQVAQGGAGGVGQQVLMVALIAKEVLGALADLDRAVGEVLMETMDQFEESASDTLQAGALALGATSIALAAKDITTQKRGNIDEQEKFFKADGMDKLMSAAKKQQVDELRAKKPVLTAAQRLEKMESDDNFVVMPAGRRELRKLEAQQLARRIENSSAKSDQLEAVLGDGELVSGALGDALCLAPGTSEVLNAGDSAAAGAMLLQRQLAVLGYADVGEAKRQAAHGLAAQIGSDDPGLVDKVLPSYDEYERRAIASAMAVLQEESERWRGQLLEPTRERLMEVMTDVTTQKTREAVEEKSMEAIQKKLGSGGMGMQDLVVDKVMRSIKPKIQLLTAQKLARMYQLTHDAYLEFSQHVLPAKTNVGAAIAANKFATKLRKKALKGAAATAASALSDSGSLAAALAVSDADGSEEGSNDAPSSDNVPTGSGAGLELDAVDSDADGAAAESDGLLAAAPAHRPAPLLAADAAPNDDDEEITLSLDTPTASPARPTAVTTPRHQLIGSRSGAGPSQGGSRAGSSSSSTRDS